MTESGWAVFGWDKGYVAFDVIDRKAKNGTVTSVVETQHSSDGLSWFAGQSFTPPPADETIKDLKGVSGVYGVLEGPAGLLAYDYTDTICSAVATIYPLAVSPDGVTWQTVKGSVVGNSLDAGPMGSSRRREPASKSRRTASTGPRPRSAARLRPGWTASIAPCGFLAASSPGARRTRERPGARCAGQK